MFVNKVSLSEVPVNTRAHQPHKYQPIMERILLLKKDEALELFADKGERLDTIGSGVLYIINKYGFKNKYKVAIRGKRRFVVHK